jgi:hypothetical protein
MERPALALAHEEIELKSIQLGCGESAVLVQRLGVQDRSARIGKELFASRVEVGLMLPPRR